MADRREERAATRRESRLDLMALPNLDDLNKASVPPTSHHTHTVPVLILIHTKDSSIHSL